MGSALRYWRFVRLDTTGQRRVEEVADAKRFFQQQFAELIEQSEVPDALIQRQCVELMRSAATKGDSVADLAEVCLRCFISNEIDAVCQQLAVQFGSQHGFNRNDLLPYVLNDILSSRLSSPYHSLARQILDSYDPDKAGLSTWVNRLVKRHDDLEQFLLEHGVYLVSDWAILNDTQPKQLARILGEFHSLSNSEIEQAIDLLQRYHAIYRQARIQQRLTQRGGRCQPPTREQLIQIGQDSARRQSGEVVKTTPETVLSQLQSLAAKLRQYRVAVRRGGIFQSESIDEPALQPLVHQIEAPEQNDATEAQTMLLERYRNLFLQDLDATIAQVTQHRLTVLPRKRSPQQFLTALHLLHCRGLSMTDIASQVDLGGQSQVSRLLQLPEFRTDIRQRWLMALRNHVPSLVQEFDSLERLKDWNQRLEQVLQEEVETVIQAATAEASTVRSRPFTSLFAQRLCHYLDALGA